jgi:hypothetical protein
MTVTQARTQAHTRPAPAIGIELGITVKELERVKGIEPSYSAWKAAALPLSYTRVATDHLSRRISRLNLPRPPMGRLKDLNRPGFAAYIDVFINNERR